MKMDVENLYTDIKLLPHFFGVNKRVKFRAVYTLVYICKQTMGELKLIKIGTGVEIKSETRYL